MILKKAFKYRIYPTKEQEKFLAQQFGCKRFIFNYYLNQKIKRYEETKKTTSYFDDNKDSTQLKKKEEYAFLNDVPESVIEHAIQDLNTAYKNFFKKQNKFPKFKSRYDKQSFKVRRCISIKNGGIQLPKFKNPIKIKGIREVEGVIKSATVSKTPTNKYFVSLLYETEHKPHRKNKKKVGLDLGIKTLVTCSDGKIYENNKTTNKYQKKLAFQQKQLSKKVKGSNNRKKQKLKVAKVYEKITNTRNDHIHKITTEIVKKNNIICVEDLSITNMMKNRNLAKSIADASWGSIINQLKYKTDWNQRTIISVGKFFPSSKTCNSCKTVNQDLTLNDRVWICSNCGEILDRDFNASKNILNEGLNIFKSGCGVQSDSKQKLGEALPIGKSMKQDV